MGGSEGWYGKIDLATIGEMLGTRKRPSKRNPFQKGPLVLKEMKKGPHMTPWKQELGREYYQICPRGNTYDFTPKTSVAHGRTKEERNVIMGVAPSYPTSSVWNMPPRGWPRKQPA